MASSALACAADDAVDCVDLLAADHPDQRRSDHGSPVDGAWVYRARFVARPRKHRPDAGPTPHDLAGGHDPIHALVRDRLERGDQWRLPHGHLTLTSAAVGNLPAGDHRRHAFAVIEAAGAGARCDAGNLARRSSALPPIRQLGSGCRTAWGADRLARMAGGNWRCADRPVRPAGGDRRGERYSSGPKGGDHLEYFRPRRLRRCDHHGGDHVARPPPADRSGRAEHRGRRSLSGCADPCFRGASRGPPARAVAAPADPAIHLAVVTLEWTFEEDIIPLTLAVLAFAVATSCCRARPCAGPSWPVSANLCSPASTRPSCWPHSSGW